MRSGGGAWQSRSDERDCDATDDERGSRNARNYCPIVGPCCAAGHRARANLTTGGAESSERNRRNQETLSPSSCRPDLQLGQFRGEAGAEPNDNFVSRRLGDRPSGQSRIFLLDCPAPAPTLQRPAWPYPIPTVVPAPTASHANLHLAAISSTSRSPACLGAGPGAGAGRGARSRRPNSREDPARRGRHAIPI